MVNSAAAKRFVANLYIGAILAAGLIAFGWSLGGWHTGDPLRFGVYLAVACLASGMKVVLPSINGTMSTNFLFVLIGVVELSRSETVVMACAGIVVQTFWHAVNRPRPVQIAFNTASMALASTAAFEFYHLDLFRASTLEMPILLLLAASVFFLANTLPVAVVIALTEWKAVWPVWKNGYFWSFPAYLVGAAVAAFIDLIGRYVGWQTSILLLPVLYLIHNTHRLHVEKLREAKLQAEKEKKHSEEMSAIHLRTVEALALAIEAKDGTTHDHLERVQIYALEVAKELGLSTEEMEAVRAASILHDIGKLAVPEYIISKPGKLTPAEFEKMKIHPVVGAQILEQVQFPYPVAPIVRSHHEKWDGTGYPDGLRGEEIPVGARILAAVDCLDALASDRQYRRALPLNEAMGVLIRDSGKHFDPRIVQILERRYVELEHMAKHSSQADDRPKLLTDLKIERGAAPAAGFACEGDSTADLNRLNTQLQDNGEFRTLAKNLQVAIGFDAFAIFHEIDGHMKPVFTQGPAAWLIAKLNVPVGKGLVGWVVENHKPILNGNPTVEPGYPDSITNHAGLSSALAVPLESESGPTGVACLYRIQRDAFHRDHLRMLQTLSASNVVQA